MTATPNPLRDLRAEAHQIIYSDSEVRGHKELDEDQCVVVAHTTMVPLVFTSEKGEPIGDPRYPPAITLKLTIREPRSDLQMVHSVLGAERIRDYLAYSTGASVPIRWVMASKRFLMPQEFNFDVAGYMPTEVLVGQGDYSGWSHLIETGMKEAERLLRVTQPDSPLDRAIDLLGRAVTTSDRESSFLYCWRAIETVSALDLEDCRAAVRGGDLRASDPYLGSQLSQFLKGEEEIELSIGQRCYVTLLKRVPGFDLQKGREWYRLRGKVAHAGLSAEDYRNVLYAVPEVFALAKTCVGSRLKEQESSSESSVLGA
jgi:hypothetical protein